MIRTYLEHYICPNCKHNAMNCIEYKNCNDCPMAKDGAIYCLCLQEATKEEISNGRCMYFEKEPAND